MAACLLTCRLAVGDLSSRGEPWGQLAPSLRLGASKHPQPYALKRLPPPPAIVRACADSCPPGYWGSFFGTDTDFISCWTCQFDEISPGKQTEFCTKCTAGTMPNQDRSQCVRPEDAGRWRRGWRGRRGRARPGAHAYAERKVCTCAPHKRPRLLPGGSRVNAHALRADTHACMACMRIAAMRGGGSASQCRCEIWNAHLGPDAGPAQCPCSRALPSQDVQGRERHVHQLPAQLRQLHVGRHLHQVPCRVWPADKRDRGLLRHP